MCTAADIPTAFCWTRFGTEAGETVDQILARKESERSANGGIFLWGIGNSVGRALVELARRVGDPQVLFSPIKSAPRPSDVSPRLVVEWRAAETIDGTKFPIPTTFQVRGGSATETMNARYALVCASDRPLETGDHGTLHFEALRNLLSGNKLGSSQVTAVVERVSDDAGLSRAYPVAMSARLVSPYFVRLRDPVALERLPSWRASDGLGASALSAHLWSAPFGKQIDAGRVRR
jgi:hypothetical protein